MTKHQQVARYPYPGEVWHRITDPEDIAMIYEVRGDHPSVYWTSPASPERGRPVAKTWATRMNDFIHDFAPPRKTHTDGKRMTGQDPNSGTRGEYIQWVIETRLNPSRLGIVVTRNPYPELARRELEELRAAHPGLKFQMVRETVTRVEEDW